ncbi:hypothetical protein L249_3240, partial [Ophiocordyceps polyrhachis-furcata BCC 54312]
MDGWMNGWMFSRRPSESRGDFHIVYFPEYPNVHHVPYKALLGYLKKICTHSTAAALLRKTGRGRERHAHVVSNRATCLNSMSILAGRGEERKPSLFNRTGHGVRWFFKPENIFVFVFVFFFFSTGGRVAAGHLGAPVRGGGGGAPRTTSTDNVVKTTAFEFSSSNVQPHSTGPLRAFLFPLSLVFHT